MDDRPGRSDNDQSEPTAAEGVRIIGAEEAAEAMERGEVAPRLSEAEPRYGDRPTPLPEGTRPALRFPLDADSDPTSVTRPPILPSRLPGDDPEPSGSVELPHWTDPPTGEVPAVLAEAHTGDDEDLDAWSSFATTSPAHWRGESEDWSEEDGYGESLEDDESRLGALDDRDRPLDEELFSFDDVDDLVEQRAATRAASRAHGLPTIDSGIFGDDVGTDPTLVDLDDEPVFSDSEQAHSEVEPSDGGSTTRPVRRRRPARPTRAGDDGSGGRDLPTAVGAGVAIAIVALVLFAFGSAFAAALVVAVTALCGIEFFGAVQRAGSRPAALLGLVAVISFPIATYWRGESAVLLLLTLTVVFALLWYLSGAGGDAPLLEGVGVTLLGVMWIGMLGSFATLILRSSDGRGILLSIILVTVAYDVGGLFAGRSFGNRPLSAASPNKTVEGLLGGAVVAILVGLLLGGFGLGYPFHGWSHGFVLGLTAAVFAPLGDLCESAIKRDLHIKDMGTLIPGHGGMLDRVDGLLFVLPAVYYVVIALHWM